MYKWAYRQYRKKEYVKLYLERNAFSGDHMGRVSRKAGSGNRRSLKRSRGSRDLEYHHAGDRSFLERDLRDRKQSRAGRTAFRENETGFEIPLSGSAVRL